MDLVYIFQLTYDEVIDILGLKYIPTKTTGYSLNTGIYEITDINKTLEYISTDSLKVTITIDDIRLKSNLKNIQTLMFTKRVFFLYIIRFYSIPFRSIR